MTAFCVFEQFNDSYAFRIYPRLTAHQQIHQENLPDMSGASRPGVQRCGACGELLNKWNDPLAGLVLKKRQYDISSTYDGVVVVSEAFKTVYETEHLSGLSFRPLPDDPGFYAITAGRIVEYDAERRQTLFVKRCHICNQFESVAGATPAYLKKGAIIGIREFVRTDLEFGSTDEKAPLLICGGSAADTLRKTKMRGRDLIAINDPEIKEIA
jgi:hypothetical protein